MLFLYCLTDPHLYDSKDKALKQDKIDDVKLYDKNNEKSYLDTEKVSHIQSTFQSSKSTVSTSASLNAEATSGNISHQLPSLSKIYSCRVCLKRFDVQSKLKFHRIKKHNNSDKSPKKHANSIDKDSKQEQSKQKDIENNSHKELHEDEIKDPKMKDKEETNENFNTNATKTCDEQPKMKETDVITEKITDLEANKNETIVKDQSVVDDHNKSTINPNIEDENNFSRQNKSHNIEGNMIIEKLDLNTNKSMPDSTDFDDNQDHEPLIIDETDYATNNEELDKPSFNLNTDSILQNSDLQSNETTEQSVDETFSNEQQEKDMEHNENDTSKEEFKMPDNFDLPEDYFISIKRNRNSHPPNSEFSTKAIQPSAMERDRTTSNPAPNNDKTIKQSNVIWKERSQLVPLVSRTSYPLKETFGPVSI